MDAAFRVLKSSGPAAAAFGLGWFLRQSVCNESDGEVGLDSCVWIFELTNNKRQNFDRHNFWFLQTAARFAQWVTLPALILQSLGHR